jgi:hypothetical protein
LVSASGHSPSLPEYGEGFRVCHAEWFRDGGAPMHLTTEEERRALKTGFRVLVQHSGGLEAAAAASRLNKTHLAASYDQEAKDRFPALDVVADLERAAGVPVVTKLLAAMHGLALVHVEPIGGCAISAIASVGQNSSDVFAAFVRAVSDGVITEAERADLRQKMLDLVAVATEAAAILEGVKK